MESADEGSEHEGEADPARQALVGVLGGTAPTPKKRPAQGTSKIRTF